MLEYAVSPVESGQFMPYERALYANYSNFSYPVAASVIEESGRMLQRYTIYGLKKVGNAALFGSGINEN